MAILGFGKGRRKGGEFPPRRMLDLKKAHETGRLYVIGDIHGCFDLLLGAEARIRADLAARGGQGLVVMLGDYVDRGPQSARVIDHLIQKQTDGLRRVALCGNHDDVFLAVLEQRIDPATWLDVGGRETLMSYGINVNDATGRGRRSVMDVAMRIVPPHHLAFLRQLPILAVSGDYVFVHAGIQPGRPIAEQADTDMLWIREPFLSMGPQLPLTVVHGHTIVPKPFYGRGRIGIDTGAFRTGRLTVVKIEENRVSLI